MTLSPWGEGFFAGITTMFLLVMMLRAFMAFQRYRRIRAFEKPCRCGGDHTAGEGLLAPRFCNDWLKNRIPLPVDRLIKKP